MKNLASLSLLVAFAACGDGKQSENQEPQPDAPIAQPDAPSNACPIAPTVSRAAFVDASIAYLRTAYDVTTGFEGGTVAYGEGWVSLGDSGCPLADWTTLSYVVDVDSTKIPLELRATHHRIAAVWALNGRRFLSYLPDAPLRAEDKAPWFEGRLPDSYVAVAKDNANQNQLDALAARIQDDHPAVTVTWLDQIRILTLSTPIGGFGDDTSSGNNDPATGRIPDVEAAAQQVRDSNLFSSIEQDGFVLRIPHEIGAAALVDDAMLSPECLRTTTKTQRDMNFFTTKPSFAPPLGDGSIDNPNLCPE